MDFLEISDGIFVNPERIEAVIQDLSKPVCKVYISGISYASLLSPSIIMEFIDNANKTEDKDDTNVQMLNIMKQEVNPLGRG